jgi:hypothetical protein
MKLNSKQVKSIGIFTCINLPGANLKTDVENINVKIGDGSTATGSTFDYLINNDSKGDIYQYIENYKNERKNATSHIEPDELLVDAGNEAGEPFVPEMRVKTGFKAGFIDFINGAMILKDDGWYDEDQTLVAKNDASEEDIIKYLKTFVGIIPSYSIIDLQNAEDLGEFHYNGNLRAFKEHGVWHETNSDGFSKPHPEGDLIRLLHHSSMPMFLTGKNSNDPIYHGAVSNKMKQEEKHYRRDGMSMHGNGIYGTGSLNEAVKIYANPKSFELSGKLLDLNEKGILIRKEHVFGHLYKLETSANILQVNRDNVHMSKSLVPSLAAIILLADESKVSRTYATKCWLRMSAAQCTYDVYEAINKFSHYASMNSKDNTIFSKIYEGMGFEGINIEFPSKNLIEDAQRLLFNLKISDNYLFTSEGVNKNVLVSNAEDYLNKLKESIPPKANGRHLIVYDTSKVNKIHLKSLPVNQEILQNKDEFYSSDENITLKQVNELRSPDFDSMKLFWNEMNKTQPLGYSY